MSQLFTTGRVITDLELKSSAQQNLYLRFTLAERIGYGDNARAQYIHVWAWGYLAEKLKRCKVRKGNNIWVAGSLELEEFVRKDGTVADKQLKLKLTDWGFLPKEADKSPKEEKGIPPSDDAAHNAVEIINGEREALPE